MQFKQVWLCFETIREPHPLHAGIDQEHSSVNLGRVWTASITFCAYVLRKHRPDVCTVFSICTVSCVKWWQAFAQQFMWRILKPTVSLCPLLVIFIPMKTLANQGTLNYDYLLSLQLLGPQTVMRLFAVLESVSEMPCE